MKRILVVDRIADCPLKFRDTEIVEAEKYLTSEAYASLGRARVINLCETYQYQRTGYYVTLLAMARQHRVSPSLTSILDIKNPGLLKTISEDMHDLIQSQLSPVKAKKFELSIYFGQNTAKRYTRLSRKLSSLIDAPLLRASFKKRKYWELVRVKTIPILDVPKNHYEFLQSAAEIYLSRHISNTHGEAQYRYSMGILHNPKEEHSPSNEVALKRFIKAAKRYEIDVELIDRDEFPAVAEYDALFIRETTQVNHHTYRFARRAEQQGLIVVDDPLSILRCTNKVFLFEALQRAKLPCPKTWIVSLKEVQQNSAQFRKFPLVVKLPDSSFSKGVFKVHDEHELIEKTKDAFEESELLVLQEFLPSDFDWRIGVIDGRAFYACKYHMARKHWQIYKEQGKSEPQAGRVECVALQDVPSIVVQTAESAAELIGQGLYGVDLKEVNSKVYVIEVNDNPSIDAGYEDVLLKEKIYEEVMLFFRKRLDAQRSKLGVL